MSRIKEPQIGVRKAVMEMELQAQSAAGAQNKPRCENTFKRNQRNLSFASVEITKCISFQKFRYDKRPGKKFPDKDFMELRLSNLCGKEVRVIILCIDAEDSDIIHPNGLMGKHCHDGIYDREYVIKELHEEIRIPYIRIDRFKTRDSRCDHLKTVLEERAKYLPSPFQERCLSQCSKECTLARLFNTTDVRFAVIVSYREASSNLSEFAISHVVGDASEKTTLGIFKLSQDAVSPSGSLIDIFTTDKGPKVEGDKFSVHITCDHDTFGHWESDTKTVSAKNILYGKVISYQVPAFAPLPDTSSAINATLHLECHERNQYCSYNFMYSSHDGATIPKVISKKCERKRTLPGQYNETVPKTSNLKTRKISHASTELDVGVGNHDDRRIFQRESTAGESSVDADLTAGHIDNNSRSRINNLSFSPREGWDVQWNNSSFQDHHQVSRLCARGFTKKVVPASINTVSNEVRANRAPTELQDDPDLTTRASHQSSNLVQSSNGPMIETHETPQDTNPSTSISGQTKTHWISTRQSGHILIDVANEGIQKDFQNIDAGSYFEPCFTISAPLNRTRVSWVSPWEVESLTEKPTVTAVDTPHSHSQCKEISLTTVEVLDTVMDMERDHLIRG